MKVLFVVQGEGRGHLTQALTMEQMLKANGHEVVGMLVGKSKNRSIPEFFHRQAEAPVTTFDSPNFMPGKDNRHIGHLRSAVYNAIKTPMYLESIYVIGKQILNSGADLVVNFYEVLCGLTYLLSRPSVPMVCVGHQYLFLHPDFKFPEAHRYSRQWLTWFTRLTCFGASRVMALSVRPHADVAGTNLTVVPPLLRPEVRDITRHHGDYVTGYILNAGFAESVMAWHRQHPKVNLRFFWDKKGAPTVTKVDDTLSFHLIDDKAFLESLANCRAYATTGGFESVCEALYMGKPALMVPVHIEQECNVADFEREGAGIGAESFDISRLLIFSRDYEEDVDFRFWENNAATRIVACLENVAHEHSPMGLGGVAVAGI